MDRDVTTDHVLAVAIDVFPDIRKKIGEERAKEVIDLAWKNKPLPTHGEVSWKNDWMDYAALAFGTASFIKTMIDIHGSFPREKSERQKVDEEFRKVSLPLETKRKIINNQEAIVELLRKHFSSDDSDG